MQYQQIIGEINYCIEILVLVDCRAKYVINRLDVDTLKQSERDMVARAKKFLPTLKETISTINQYKKEIRDYAKNTATGSVLTPVMCRDMMVMALHAREIVEALEETSPGKDALDAINAQIKFHIETQKDTTAEVQ